MFAGFLMVSLMAAWNTEEICHARQWKGNAEEVTLDENNLQSQGEKVQIKKIDEKYQELIFDQESAALSDQIAMEQKKQVNQLMNQAFLQIPKKDNQTQALRQMMKEHHVFEDEIQMGYIGENHSSKRTYMLMFLVFMGAVFGSAIMLAAWRKMMCSYRKRHREDLQNET